MIWHHWYWTVERRKFAARFRTYLGIQGCCKLQFTEYADSKIINNPNCNVLSLLFPGRRKARRGSGQSSVCCKRCSKAGRAWGWLQDCHQRWARRMSICVSPPCPSSWGTADELATWVSWCCSFYKSNLQITRLEYSLTTAVSCTLEPAM